MAISPFPEDLASVRLKVETGSSLAEVFLIDHAFALVARSLGQLDAKVEPGVYKVKAQLGGAIAEVLVVADHDQEVDLRGRLAIASPVPLAGTSQTHEFHMAPAAEESRRVTFSPGIGAQIFLCARRWSGPTPTAREVRPAPRLSLQTTDGEAIFDLRESGHGPSDEWDPMVGATVEVDPGSYLLRWWDDAGLAAEQSVQATFDWQTQVFLLEDARDDDKRRRGISILMAHGEFRPDDGKLLRADEARAALADERRVSSTSNEAMFADFESPMLGLYGAHLMLLAREAKDEASRRKSDVKRLRAPVDFDQASFDKGVGRLVDLLGREHPDVTALATQATNQPIEQLEPVTVPPMLWRSWLLLIEASNERPDLLPTSTWRRALKVLPLRPFLVWSADEDSTETVERWQRGVAPLLQASAPSNVDSPAEADEILRRLTRQLLAPRAAIDELAGAAGAGAPS